VPEHSAAHAKLDPMKKDPARLQAAIIAYQQELDEVDRAIALIQRRLGIKPDSPSPHGRSGRKSGGKRKLARTADQ